MDIDKFSHLKSFLCDSALCILSGLSLSSSNYNHAIQLLQERYGNTQVLNNAYMKKFVTIPAVKNDRDVCDLRKLYDEVETKVRNLRTLNVDTSTYGSLLVPLLNEKLSPDLRLKLSQNVENEVWILDNMLEMLKLEVEAKGRSLTIVTGSNFNDRTPFHQPDFTTSALSNLAARKQCVYCGLSNHLPHKRLTVTDKQERKTVLKTKNLHYICLEPGHIAKFCSLGYVCKKCDKKHHVSICSHDASSPLNSQETHQNDSTLNNFYSNQNNVLLQTAYVEASDLELKNRHFVNALFDSGSQSTYISLGLRNKLGLKTLQKERIFIKTFGNKSSNTLPVDVVPLKINSDQKIVTIEAIFTPVICADLLNQNIQHVSLLVIHI